MNNFMNDKEEQRHAGKRCIPQNRAPENDMFFSPNHGYQPNSGSSQNGYTRDPNMTKKEYNEQKSEQARQKLLQERDDFYKERPDLKPELNQHQRAMQAEKSKGVPWGTLDDLKPTDHGDSPNPYQQQHRRSAGGGAGGGGGGGVPWATSNDTYANASQGTPERFGKSHAHKPQSSGTPYGTEADLNYSKPARKKNEETNGAPAETRSNVRSQITF